MGITALVLSLAAWPLSFLFAFPGLIAGILAIIFGAIGMKRDNGKGLAIAGFVVGIVYVIFFLIGACTGLFLAGLTESTL